MKKLLILSLILSVSTYSLYSQNKTVKGRVISEHFDILIGVSIRVNDTVEIGRTDMKGYFQIDIPVKQKEIKFMHLGLDQATIELNDNCNEIEVVMMLSGTYDFISLKRIDRRRKKRYKKLPKIHKQAFEKNIFDTNLACYNRTFEPRSR
jgi:hypothetical protein